MTGLKAALFCFALANFTHGFKYPARPASPSTLQPRAAPRPFQTFLWRSEAAVNRRDLCVRRATGDDEVEGEKPSESSSPEESLTMDELLHNLVRQLAEDHEELADGAVIEAKVADGDDHEELADETVIEAKVADVEEPEVEVSARGKEQPEDRLTADALLDEMVRDLAEEKEKLSKKGEYEKARKIRDRIHLAHVEEGPRVLAKNAEFYRAFSDSDISYMKELWEQAPDVSCIHPGVSMRVGYNAVIRKWESMFKGHKQNTAERFSVRPGNVRVFVRGTTAVVTCTEKLFRKGSDNPNWMQQSLQSTNIFRRSHGEWRMVHHHASPVIDTEKREKRGRSQVVDGGRVVDGMQVFGPFEVRQGESLDLDAIKDAIKNKLQSQDGLRVISVNDNDDGNDEDDQGSGGIEDITAALGKKIREALGSDGEVDEARMVVRVGNARIDEDQKEDIIESDDPRLVAPLEASEEDVRKETVSLIRRLSGPEEGRLTARQKQLLLGDVIRAAADKPSRKSFIEVAYTVLMDSDKEEEALDEFAEQCVLLAEELEENN